jgi:uncharacterized repeat protein (TIGR02059 family)
MMKKLLFTIFAAAVMLSGCNKSDNANTTTGGPGRLSVKITDAPFNISSVESALVTITKIEIRKAGANDGDPFIVLTETPRTVDLVKLRNGITEELVNLEIAPGDYDLVRLYVDEANLTLKEPSETFNMKVPSGSQTGIKLFVNPAIHVEGGISGELVLDFDLSKSFVMRGKDAHNGFIFKPVIRAANISTTGRIEGIVTDNADPKNIIADATVTLMNDTAEVASTTTDANGKYVFIGLNPGTYSMLAAMENYDSASAEGIVVVAGNKTIHDFVLKSLPVYVSSVIETATPDKLEMTYSLALADTSLPDVSSFTVMVNSVARTVNAVAISGTKVVLTLASAVAKGETVTVAYTRPETNPLQTTEGLKAASITVQSVTNNVN